MERESFKSRAGFLLVSAGCAIGIGNVWKFPWLVGQNGGGLFVLIYLLFLAVLGLPVLSMELAVGRASRQSAVGAYKVLKPEAPAWQLHGWASMLGNYVLMMFYTTVSGWMLSYFVKFATGTFDGMQLEKVDAVFGAMLGDPKEMGLMMAITVVGGFLVLAFGMLFPNSRIYLYFLFPIKAKWFVIGYAVIELLSGFFTSGNVAHFAHLGGMLFGLILILIWKKKGKLYGERGF